MSKLNKIIIAALGDNNELGLGGDLPWRNIPEDKERFRELTRGHPVIQGRKTYESIVKVLGKPLPGRTNIVLSTSLESRDGLLVARTIDEAVRFADAEGKDTYIIGGEDVYRKFLPIADKMELTRVQGTYKADAFFPEVDWNVWNLIGETSGTSRNPKNPQDEISFTFQTYERMR